MTGGEELQFRQHEARQSGTEPLQRYQRRPSHRGQDGGPDMGEIGMVVLHTFLSRTIAEARPSVYLSRIVSRRVSTSRRMPRRMAASFAETKFRRSVLAPLPALSRRCASSG